jgi:hypothetical protein
MTSILNKCENLDELTQFRNSRSPSLSQGMKFKQFQNKFMDKSNKNNGNNNNNNNIYDSNFVEGFEGSNTNPLVEKILMFYNNGSPKTCYVTSEGILQQFDPSKSRDTCMFQMSSVIIVNAELPATHGTYIPELKLTTGEPMKEGEKCGKISSNENMNLLGKVILFLKNVFIINSTLFIFKLL